MPDMSADLGHDRVRLALVWATNIRDRALLDVQYVDTVSSAVS
jgi:hypothetical protein